MSSPHADRKPRAKRSISFDVEHLPTRHEDSAAGLNIEAAPLLASWSSRPASSDVANSHDGKGPPHRLHRLVSSFTLKHEDCGTWEAYQHEAKRWGGRGCWSCCCHCGNLFSARCPAGSCPALAAPRKYAELQLPVNLYLCVYRLAYLSAPLAGAHFFSFAIRWVGGSSVDTVQQGRATTTANCPSLTEGSLPRCKSSQLHQLHLLPVLLMYYCEAVSFIPSFHAMLCAALPLPCSSALA